MDLIKFTSTHYKKLIYIALSLISLDILAYNLNLPPFFQELFLLGSEKNLPSIFSTLILLFSGYLLFYCYKTEKKKRTQVISPKYWLILSIIFFQLGADEWFSIHDVIGGSIGRSLSTSMTSFFGAWVFAYIILCAIFLLVFYQFILALPKRTRLLFILSGTLYVSGALGLEFLNSPEKELVSAFHHFFSAYPVKYILIVIEESFEIFGILLFIYSISDYLIREGIKSIPSLPVKTTWLIFLTMLIDTIASQISFYLNP